VLLGTKRTIDVRVVSLLLSFVLLAEAARLWLSGLFTCWLVAHAVHLLRAAYMLGRLDIVIPVRSIPAI
jgi:hypothetical protein